MTEYGSKFRFNCYVVLSILCVGLLSLGFPGLSRAVPVTVDGHQLEKGKDPLNITEFHWTLQEDVTFLVKPDIQVAPMMSDVDVNGNGDLSEAGDIDWNGNGVFDAQNKPLAGDFHKSHLPVVASGSTGATGSAPCLWSGVVAVCNDPGAAIDYFQANNATKRYFLSVLPTQEFSIEVAQNVFETKTFNMGGAQVAPGQAAVTVNTNMLPIPTAQIAVWAFNDSQPINGAIDFGELPDSDNPFPPFEVLVEEAGGKYGISSGQVLEDAFGNPLGTTYNPDGTVLVMGSGRVFIPANGKLLIENLPPAKYGIKVVAMPGWSQTSTIEGTKVIDAWVLANEPQFFTEFGLPGPHVFVGFVQEADEFANSPPGATISGQIANVHTSRQPDPTFYTGDAFGHDNCRVGLNRIGDPAPYVAHCDTDPVSGENLNSFTITNVPDGEYQLVVWNKFLTTIIAYRNITVEKGNALGDCPNLPNGSCNLQNFSVFNWFGRLENSVFFDDNGNGFWDEGELPMLEVATAIRFRDGTIYQEIPTDGEGAAPYDVVFPFFNWLVTEVDFGLALKATGATMIADHGGPVVPGEVLNPQPQADINPITGDNLSRTETGPVLTQGVQMFLGTTNRINWGKQFYQAGENGGISGMVLYGVTRAEPDPAFGAAEPWEPGIPRVQLNLYRDADEDGIRDDSNGVPLFQEPDVDNYPLGWNEGGVKGPEDVDHNLNGTFDLGDAIQVTYTDSWDDSIPEGCVKDSANFAINDVVLDCYDGLRNFNQVRPAVYDGGYAFDGIDNGIYIVEAVTPPGYELMKEEDQNVAFGADFVVPELLPPPCVGDDHLVPATTTLFPSEAAPFAGDLRPLCNRKQIRLAQNNAAVDFFLFTQAPIAGQGVGFILNDLANEFDPRSPQFGEKFAPPFAPVALRDWTGREIARVYGDEFGNYNLPVPSSFTANTPSPSGWSPAMYLACMNDPGPIDDGNGNLILDPKHDKQHSQFCYPMSFMPGSTTYLDTPVVPVAAFTGQDQFPLDCECDDGRPAIASVNGFGEGGPRIPVSNGSRVVTITSQGTVSVPNPDFEGQNTGTDPTIERDYGFGTAGFVTLNGTAVATTSWTNASITLDVPLSFGAGQHQLMVTRTDGAEPKTTKVGITLHVKGDGLLTDASQGIHHVYPDPQANLFATPIQTKIDEANDGDLVIIHPGNYFENVILHKKLDFQCSGAGSTFINVPSQVGSRKQDWVDTLFALFQNTPVKPRSFDVLPGQEVAGTLDDLITEQGSGILIVGNNTPADMALPWSVDGCSITGADNGSGVLINGYAPNGGVSNNRISNNFGVFGGGVRSGNPNLVAAVALNFGRIDIINDALAADGEKTTFTTDEVHRFHVGDIVRIRGFSRRSDYNGPQTVTAVSADGLSFDIEVDFCTSRCGRNGRETANLLVPLNIPVEGAVDALNENIHVQHNMITQNGSGGLSAGAGVSLYLGSDAYQVNNNFICGNFSQGRGAGVGHYGLSDGGSIVDNEIVFNQTFNQGLARHGGGIFIGGYPALTGGLSSGSGSVVIDSNLIQGNNAGAGEGAGIRLDTVNGQDVADSNKKADHHKVDVINNMIVNNVAGGAAGGISLQDSINVDIVHNTIANNDSTATTGAVFDLASNSSTPQPAGVVSHDNTGLLMAEVPNAYAENLFSQPLLDNNIIWHNRSFSVMLNAEDPPRLVLIPDVGAGDPAVYDDLAVLGTSGGALDPEFSILTNRLEDGGLGYSVTNLDEVNDSADPQFVSEYVNRDRNDAIVIPEVTTIAIQGAFDEGGNFIDIRYGPLTLNDPAEFGDYHITSGSSAEDTGAVGGPGSDFDDDTRPQGAGPDRGADEVPVP